MQYDPNLSSSQIDYFWSRVDQSGGNDSCWPWTRGQEGRDAKYGRGYGVAWIDGKRHKAHRLACALVKGPIPDGKVVCHKCDHPPCCNPNHLYVGTVADNVANMISKGRANREKGIRRYNAKLSEEAVLEILSGAKARTYGWGRSMAKKFGVAPTAINNIVMGRRWKHMSTNAVHLDNI